MAEKKFIDDYYSSLKTDNNDEKKVFLVNKIKAKKKKIIKKNVAKEEIIEKKESIDIEKKEIEKPKIIQSIKFIDDNKKIKKDDSKNKKEPKLQKKVFEPTEKKSFTKNKFFSNKSKNVVSKSKNEYEGVSRKVKLWFINHKKIRWRFRWVEEEDFTFTRSSKMLKVKKEEKKVEDFKQNLVERKWEIVVISDIISLKEFSEKIWIALSVLIAEFMKNWIMVNINSKIDFETASIIAELFEIKLERDKSVWVNIEDIMKWDLRELLWEDDSKKLIQRSPVISIMWHVDHWKTSLLDYIRKTKITQWEAWWITQSIWAYQIDHCWKNITFLDTPGHEAFTIMRARWAKSTDIAVLVVAADEWVKPQTLESIAHAKEADIPIIVAINKMDKEWANPDYIKWQLSENWLTPEDWWWDTPVVPVSAITWFWIPDLLEIIILVSEMKELKANPNRKWVATVLESHLDQKLWAVSTVLINTWTVNKWDDIVCQDSYWKIKILRNHSFNNIKYWIPWQPVLIVWLDKVMEWGDILQVVSSPETARQKAIDYKDYILSKKKNSMSGLDLLMSKIRLWNLQQLKIVLKADTNWALEAMKWSLEKLSTNDISVTIIYSWVWSINEWDILMSKWSEAILIWFWVAVLPSTKTLINTSWIEMINSGIIYHITERVEKIVTWMLDPKEVEVILWNAKVWWIFYTWKNFLILWLILKDENKIEKKALLRVIRNKKVIWSWKIESLKQWVEEVNNLEWPIECWIKFVWKVEIKECDFLEIYKIEIAK